MWLRPKAPGPQKDLTWCQHVRWLRRQQCSATSCLRHTRADCRCWRSYLAIVAFVPVAKALHHRDRGAPPAPRHDGRQARQPLVGRVLQHICAVR